jgi:hypothetical protein
VFCVYSRFICVKYLLLLPHHRGRPIQIENSERPDAQGLLSDKQIKLGQGVIVLTTG